MVSRDDAELAVRTLLNYLEGEEGREGTDRTPERVIEAWDEIFAGYKGDASSILTATFNGEGYDGIVLLSNIEFHSTCEHHLRRRGLHRRRAWRALRRTCFRHRRFPLR